MIVVEGPLRLRAWKAGIKSLVGLRHQINIEKELRRGRRRVGRYGKAGATVNFSPRQFALLLLFAHQPHAGRDRGPDVIWKNSLFAICIGSHAHLRRIVLYVDPP